MRPAQPVPNRPRQTRQGLTLFHELARCRSNPTGNHEGGALGPCAEPPPGSEHRVVATTRHHQIPDPVLHPRPNGSSRTRSGIGRSSPCRKRPATRGKVCRACCCTPRMRTRPDYLADWRAATAGGTPETPSAKTPAMGAWSRLCFRTAAHKALSVAPWSTAPTCRTWLFRDRGAAWAVIWACRDHEHTPRGQLPPSSTGLRARKAGTI